MFPPRLMRRYRVESRTSIEPQTLAKIQGLRLRARHIVEGHVAGLHRSPYRGFSIEFAEHRDYAPGDDLRYVDWKVFGKSDKVYLKQYEDERNLLCYLVLDISESMTYRGRGAPLSKLEYAQSVAAALAWIVLRQQDAVGLATFDNQVRAMIRPAGNPSHLEQILSAIESAQPGEKTAAGKVFHELAQRLMKRGVVIILSDFFDDLASLSAGLKHFRRRQHDVVLLHVLDPAEIEFPFHEVASFRGLEGFGAVQADPQAIRRGYLREMASFREGLEATCQAQRIDYFVVRTDQPLDAVFRHVLASRQRSTS
jgi:uncharacterized protein (DUF58 family)